MRLEWIETADGVLFAEGENSTYDVEVGSGGVFRAFMNAKSAGIYHDIQDAKDQCQHLEDEETAQ